MAVSEEVMKALAQRYAEPEQDESQDQGGDDDPVKVAAADFIAAIRNSNADALPGALVDLLDAISAGSGQGAGRGDQGEQTGRRF